MSLPFTDLTVADGNWYSGRDNTKIDTIVLHTMVGTWQSANSRFNNPTAQVSAHWGVCYDGTLKRWVEEQHTAYHAGDWGINLRSIGIEHEDMGNYNSPRPDVLYSMSGALVAQIAKQYNIPLDRAHVVGGWCGHRDIHATACPDSLDLDRIIAIAKTINSGPAPTPTPSDSTSQPVTGSSKTTVDHLAAYIAAKAPNAPPGHAKRVWDVATRFGIRPEVVLAQEIHETGYFNYGGTEVGFSVDPTFNNYCGLKTTDGTASAKFPSPDAGVLGHVAHLAWYTFPSHVNTDCSQVNDPRHFGNHKNTIHTLGDFGNGNWNTGNTYAGKMVKFYDEIMNFKEDTVAFDPRNNAADAELLKQTVRDIVLGEPALSVTAVKRWLIQHTEVQLDAPEREPDHHMRGTPPAGHPAGDDAQGKEQK